MTYASNSTLQTLSATRTRKDIAAANNRIAAARAATAYHDTAKARWEAACAQYHALLDRLPQSLAAALEEGYWRVIDPLWNRTYDERIAVDDAIYAHADTQNACAEYLEEICAGELGELVKARRDLVAAMV